MLCYLPFLENWSKLWWIFLQNIVYIYYDIIKHSAKFQQKTRCTSRKTKKTNSSEEYLYLSPFSFGITFQQNFSFLFLNTWIEFAFEFFWRGRFISYLIYANVLEKFHNHLYGFFGMGAPVAWAHNMFSRLKILIDLDQIFGQKVRCVLNKRRMVDNGVLGLTRHWTFLLVISSVIVPMLWVMEIELLPRIKKRYIVLILTI